MQQLPYRLRRCTRFMRRKFLFLIMGSLFKRRLYAKYSLQNRYDRLVQKGRPLLTRRAELCDTCPSGYLVSENLVFRRARTKGQVRLHVLTSRRFFGKLKQLWPARARYSRLYSTRSSILPYLAGKSMYFSRPDYHRRLKIWLTPPKPWNWFRDQSKWPVYPYGSYPVFVSEYALQYWPYYTHRWLQLLGINDHLLVRRPVISILNLVCPMHVVAYVGELEDDFNTDDIEYVHVEFYDTDSYSFKVILPFRVSPIRPLALRLLFTTDVYVRTHNFLTRSPHNKHALLPTSLPKSYGTTRASCLDSRLIRSALRRGQLEMRVAAWENAKVLSKTCGTYDRRTWLRNVERTRSRRRKECAVAFRRKVSKCFTQWYFLRFKPGKRVKGIIRVLKYLHRSFLSQEVGWWWAGYPLLSAARKAWSKWLFASYNSNRVLLNLARKEVLGSKVLRTVKKPTTAVKAVRSTKVSARASLSVSPAHPAGSYKDSIPTSKNKKKRSWSPARRAAFLASKARQVELREGVGSSAENNRKEV